MLIASATTLSPSRVVLGVIGYRVFQAGGKCAAGGRGCHGGAAGRRQGDLDRGRRRPHRGDVEVGGAIELLHLRPQYAQAARRIRLAPQP